MPRSHGGWSIGLRCVQTSRQAQDHFQDSILRFPSSIEVTVSMTSHRRCAVSQDITKEFPAALELGAYGPHVLDNLRAVKGLSGSECLDGMDE